MVLSLASRSRGEGQGSLGGITLWLLDTGIPLLGGDPYLGFSKLEIGRTIQSVQVHFQAAYDAGDFVEMIKTRWGGPVDDSHSLR